MGGNRQVLARPDGQRHKESLELNHETVDPSSDFNSRVGRLHLKTVRVNFDLSSLRKYEQEEKEAARRHERSLERMIKEGRFENVFY